VLKKLGEKEGAQQERNHQGTDGYISHRQQQTCGTAVPAGGVQVGEILETLMAL
jgi:hypothetical protein